MPVDKFGRMSDLKTKDTGVSLTYINNNYVRSDGETPLTGSLDMRGNTIYNVADPVNPQDVVTKVYVDNTKGSGVIGRKTKEGVSIKENMDFLGKQKIKNLPDPVDDKDAVNKKYINGIIENLTLKQGLIRENGGFNLVDSYINMNFNNIRNLGLPKDESDAVPRRFVDEMIKEVEEKINKRKHLIAVNTRYCGELKKGEYHFKFSGANFENCEEIVGQYDDLKGSITGFIMPHSGHIKKIICETLLFRSFENIAEFFFNLITKHKKDLQLNDLPLKKDLGYVDIEDLLKKGIDEFKKNLVESVGLKENKTILDFHGTGPFEFELVKFEKSFDEEDYLGTFGKLPKIISSVLIDKMETKVIQFNKKNVGLGGIMKHLNKDYLPLSEGDVINIKTKYSYQESGFPLNIGNNKRFLQNKLNNLITAGLNFNFTFLIELDPL